MWEVGGAVIIGAFMGAATAWGVRRATCTEDMAKAPELVLTLLLALAVLGAARLAHHDRVAVLDPVLDHRVAPHAERVPLARAEERWGDLDLLGRFNRLDRPARRHHA